MNDREMRRLLEDEFTLGSEATVAVGPVGRQTSASTNVQMSAEILSWSRSNGRFAGSLCTGRRCGRITGRRLLLPGHEILRNTR